MKFRNVPQWASVLLVTASLGTLLWFELRRPLRRSVESKLRRDTRNLAVAGAAAAAVQLAELPVSAPLAALAANDRWGILGWASVPLWLEVPVAVLLLDYTLYLWHILTHKVPALWRFHIVHHADLDLDATTALRFHFGEMLASIPFRAAQIVTIGVSPLALSVWQAALLVSILFHHSNVELPENVERRLSRFLVTPRMHGIHHSKIPAETNSNWSSGLSIWDRLHGTLRLDVPQEQVTIGVPQYNHPAEVTLPKILAMPFRGRDGRA